MKKKITAIALVVALLAIALIGGTMAYFTDTKDVTNTFTAGSVKISLDEAKVKADDNGNLVADGTNRTSETEKTQSYKLFPGMTVTKDPTIKVASDSEDAYIAAKITIKGDLLDLYGADTANPKTYYNLDITKFVSGGLIQKGSTQSWSWNGLDMIYTDDAGNVYYQDASNGNAGANSEWVMYVFVKDIQKANDTIALFTTLEIDPDYGNTEMAKLNNASVQIKAFAVQTNGFKTTATNATNCFTAMTTAFPNDFNLIKGEE